jgi:transglutaminase-like putative cysteine protease
MAHMGFLLVVMPRGNSWDTRMFRACPFRRQRSGTILSVDAYWKGWSLLKAILDYTHDRIRFSYPNARDERTAFEAHEERTGVCRDFAHLAIALCRCMNIPARYCTGYLGDIGVPADPAPMDFSAWFEVFMGGRWWALDARHNQPRIGRIVVARGRDAADVAISTAFGSATLAEFKVITEL